MTANDDGTTGSSDSRLAGEWRVLSSADGDLPVPSDHPQQVATVVFDINLDGLDDFVIAARKGTDDGIVWYERTSTGWARHLLTSDALFFEAGGAHLDVDGDGDQDLVIGLGSGETDLYWYENPHPNHSPDTSWTRRLVAGAPGKQHHDQLVGDFDGDGEDELAYWKTQPKQLFVAEIPGRRVHRTVAGPARPHRHGHLRRPRRCRHRRERRGRHRRSRVLVRSRCRRYLRRQRDRPGDVVHPGCGGPARRRWVDPRWCSTRVTRSAPCECTSGTDRHGSGPSCSPAPNRGHSLDVGDIDGDGHLDIFSAEMTLGGNSDATMRMLFGDSTGSFDRVDFPAGFDHHESKLSRSGR